MYKITVEDLILKLIKHFELKNMTELAEKLNVTQSVMSNWKSRNALGAISEKILEIDPLAFKYIFEESDASGDTQNNTITNSSINGNGISNAPSTINNFKQNTDLICDEFTKTLFKQLCTIYKDDQTTLQSLIFNLIQNANTK